MSERDLIAEFASLGYEPTRSIWVEGIGTLSLGTLIALHPQTADEVLERLRTHKRNVEEFGAEVAALLVPYWQPLELSRLTSENDGGAE